MKAMNLESKLPSYVPRPKFCARMLFGIDVTGRGQKTRHHKFLPEAGSWAGLLRRHSALTLHLSEYELRPALQNPLSAFTWRGTSVYRFHEVCQECISLSPRPHFSRPPESSLGTRLSVYKSAYSVAIHLSYETQKTREK